MSQAIGSTSITIRCPSNIVDSINQQVKQTKQNKTDVIVGMLSNSIPSLHITERAKLPPKPGIYLVYTPDHQILSRTIYPQTTIYNHLFRFSRARTSRYCQKIRSILTASWQTRLDSRTRTYSRRYYS